MPTYLRCLSWGAEGAEPQAEKATIRSYRDMDNFLAEAVGWGEEAILGNAANRAAGYPLLKLLSL